MRNYLVLLYVVSVFDLFYLTPFSLYADIYIQIFSLLGLLNFVLFRLYKKLVVRFVFIVIMTLILTSVLSRFPFKPLHPLAHLWAHALCQWRMKLMK